MRQLKMKFVQICLDSLWIGNKIMADETRAVREKIDMILMDVVKEWDGYEI